MRNNSTLKRKKGGLSIHVEHKINFQELKWKVWYSNLNKFLYYKNALKLILQQFSFSFLKLHFENSKQIWCVCPSEVSDQIYLIGHQVILSKKSQLLIKIIPRIHAVCASCRVKSVRTLSNQYYWLNTIINTTM